MTSNNPIYQKKYHRKHYLANRERYKKQAKEQRQRMLAVARAAKERPCVDCGIQYPYWVMQFDHIRGSKINDVARLVLYGNLVKLLAEIEKCEVVCANCHADRTFKRNHARLV